LVVEHTLSTHQALGSIPSNPHQKNPSMLRKKLSLMSNMQIEIYTPTLVMRAAKSFIMLSPASDNLVGTEWSLG
jgi:hypothetical protein